MSRVIYSLYIDIPEDDLDFFDKNIIKKDQTPTNINTKNQFKEHYSKIIDNKKRYADNIGVDFHLHENDKDFKYYVKYFKTHFPFITMYNIVNFYKLELMNNYLVDHDEVLYLDFDAMPVTKDNFFEVWDLSKGIAVYNNNKNIRPKYPFIRSILIKLEECLGLKKNTLEKLAIREEETSKKENKDFIINKFDLINTWQGSFLYFFILILTLFILKRYFILNVNVIEIQNIETKIIDK